MKKLMVYIVAFLAVFNSCKKEDSINELPDGLISIKMDTIIYSRIVELFPDNVNAVDGIPSLFSDTVQKRIVLTKESKVFIVFIAEGAEFKNSLGWYSYPLGMAPDKAADLTKEIVFPNISGVGEGGLLVQGDLVQLGDNTFPTGTVIGFFLISDGWKNGSIAYDNPTYYTDYYYNVTTAQQHVLFRETESGSIVLGFEDSDFTNIETDNDFNDILLNVTDNNGGYLITSFNMEKIPEF